MDISLINGLLYENGNVKKFDFIRKEKDWALQRFL